jgi:hypothetical protein
MPGHDEQGLRLQRYAAGADFFSCAAAIFRSSTKRWYSRQARQPLASSRRTLRLPPDLQDADVMGFPAVIESVVALPRSMQGARGSFDPIGIAHEKHKCLIPIDSSGHLSFILEHIMNI